MTEKRDYFDEIADLLAGSYTSRRLAHRDAILAALRRRYPSEAALRQYIERAMAEAQRRIDELERDGSVVIGIAQEMERDGSVIVGIARRGRQ